jgi:hypothetical protein
MFRTTVVTALLTLWLAAPTQAQTLDPRFRADIEKLMEVTGAGNIGTQMASLSANQIIQMVRTAQPEIPERAFTIIRETLDAEFSRAFTGDGELGTGLVAVYAKHFTHAEIGALLDFYSTPVGKKSIAVMPTLMQEGALVGQQWGEANMPRVEALIVERFKREGIIIK